MCIAHGGMGQQPQAQVRGVPSAAETQNAKESQTHTADQSQRVTLVSCLRVFVAPSGLLYNSHQSQQTHLDTDRPFAAAVLIVAHTALAVAYTQSQHPRS